jgi:transcriptional regulator with XRE-family HTH domain
MSLGDKVKRCRLDQGMNQKQLAEASGITQATISRLESGKVNQLKSDAIVSLAKALKVSVDFLLGKTETMTPDTVIANNPEAKYLFEGYEKLSPDGRKQLKEFVKFLEMREINKE